MTNDSPNIPNDRSGQLTLSQISAQRRGRGDMGARQRKWSANSVIGTFLLSSLLPEGCLWVLQIFSHFVVFFKAGAGGGLVASIATCPLDVIKTKLQAQRAVQGQQAYLGVLGVCCIHSCFSTFQFISILLFFSWEI